MRKLESFNTILVVPDRHLPYNHVDTIPFLRALIETYNPDCVVDTGDEVDLHTISFHDKDPDLPYSPSSELDTAINYQKGFYELLDGRPCFVCDSNHGSLVYRQLKANGLPAHIAKPWHQIMEAPDNVKWGSRWILESGGQKILFQHSIKADALAASKHKGMNVVQGHYHTKAEIRWWANDLGQRFFGATVGCLIDEVSLAFAYNRVNIDKVILGAMVIIHGVPVYVPMLLTEEGRWARSVF